MEKINVDYVKPELEEMASVYTLVEDCLAGDKQIKSKGDLYLPRPDPGNKSKENEARYLAYKQRAIFYNVTNRTLVGLNGQVFMRDPIVKLPDQMSFLIDNIDGCVGLNQFAQKLNYQVLALGRAGLFTDYPSVNGPKTAIELEAEYIRPTITRYHPTSIINWDEKYIGSMKVLSLVVLMEQYIVKQDMFAPTYGRQIRVLYLDNKNIYNVSIYREVEPNEEDLEVPVAGVPNKPKKIFKLYSNVQPRNQKGETRNTIPFEFVGSKDNDPDIDDAPMYNIAVLNIGHFINSADYEDSCHMVGQPTPVFTGLTEEWVKVILKNQMHIGSRASIPLPENSTAMMLQAEPNTMPIEAMRHKEDQMVAMGAKLIQPSVVERTATEAGMEKSAENSIVSNVAKNGSVGIERSMNHCAWYMGLDGKDIVYKLQTDFDNATMSSEDRKQLIEEYNAGVLGFSEVRNALRKKGLATEQDDIVRQEVAKKKEQENKQMNQNANIAQVVKDNG